MRQLRVELGQRSYNIHIQAGILNEVGLMSRDFTSVCKVMLVSNPTVYNLYGQQTMEALHTAGFEPVLALMPDGEEYKNLDEAARVLDTAVESHLERSSLIFALGGGVVGDLAGFAAAIFQRGIDFVQIPTTLLAQVDSSVGGKVAVNHALGKNLLGAFHQPRAVFIDPQSLNTLEERDFKSGLGEAVKYGIVYDADFFAFLEENAAKIIKKEEECIEELIYHSCRIKSLIVAADEKENGLRMILNLGHTFGHAVETLGGYGFYRHGEAVVMGTMAASYLALEMGLLTEAELHRITALYHALGLKTVFPSLPSAEVYQAMLGDKKVKAEKIRLVLPRGIGSFYIADDVNKEQVIRAIQTAQTLK